MVLLGYIFAIMGVVSYNLAGSAEYRISCLLSQGNIDVAKMVASRTMTLAVFFSLVDVAILFPLKLPLISLLTSNNDLSGMLNKCMPLVLLCHPLLTMSSTGAFFNNALAMYKRATKVEIVLSILITIPLAWVSTFHLQWDISGLLVAYYIGHATKGAMILAVYNNADWEKAVRKNKKIAGILESSKIGDDAVMPGVLA